jgi:hypothetical protein
LQRAVDFRSGHQVIANLVSSLQILATEVKTECIPAQTAFKERVGVGRRVRVSHHVILRSFVFFARANTNDKIVVAIPTGLGTSIKTPMKMLGVSSIQCMSMKTIRGDAG